MTADNRAISLWSFNPVMEDFSGSGMIVEHLKWNGTSVRSQERLKIPVNMVSAESQAGGGHTVRSWSLLALLSLKPRQDATSSLIFIVGGVGFEGREWGLQSVKVALLWR